MPPKRKGSPIATPSKSPRIPNPEPPKDGYTSVLVGTVLDKEGAVVIGYLKDAECVRMENNARSGRYGENRRIIANPPRGSVQLSRFWSPLPHRFHSADEEEKVATKPPTYLEATRGLLVIPGLEDRFRAHVLKRYNKNPDPGGDTVASHLIGGLEATAAVREKDNLYHIYALFSQSVRLNYELERIFLALITGSSNKNKHGVVITAEHTDTYCYLLEAEGRFGLPTPELTWIKGTEKWDRSSKLDLSYACADLFFARYQQSRGVAFVRPLCASLVTNIADGYQNGIKPALCEYYGIKDATKPAYMGL